MRDRLSAGEPVFDQELFGNRTEDVFAKARALLSALEHGGASSTCQRGWTGGIRPPKRHSSKLALNLSEREEISRAVVAGCRSELLPCSLGERRP